MKFDDSDETEDDDEDNYEIKLLLSKNEQSKYKKNYEVSYKTGTKSILCRRLFKLGDCQLGEKCPYAHSKKELKFNSSQEWIETVNNLGSIDRNEIDFKFPNIKPASS